MPKGDTFSLKREIDNSKLSNLKALGYKGDRTIEELLEALTKRHTKDKINDINGRAWWIDFKDSAQNKGIAFIDAVYLELEKEFKNGK